MFSGEWCIGRIYETRTGPADLRWVSALHAPSKPGTYAPTTGGNAGPGQGRVRGELEAVEGVEGVGGDGGSYLSGGRRSVDGWVLHHLEHFPLMLIHNLRVARN